MPSSPQAAVSLAPRQPEGVSSRPYVRWLIFAFFAWSLAMRIWLGSVELNKDRYWDEHYALRNISKLLKQGTLEPANGYQPSLSYLPQAAVVGAMDAVYRMTGSERFRVFGKYEIGRAHV